LYVINVNDGIERRRKEGFCDEYYELTRSFAGSTRKKYGKEFGVCPKTFLSNVELEETQSLC
jgi:hypothetical protein